MTKILQIIQDLRIKVDKNTTDYSDLKGKVDKNTTDYGTLKAGVDKNTKITKP